jgi:hypothetical protein
MVSDLEALYLLIKTGYTSVLEREIDLSLNMDLSVEEIDVVERCGNIQVIKGCLWN